MAIMSNTGRGIRSVNNTVNRLTRIRTSRRLRSALAINSCGMASSHWASGRHRSM